ncbi:TetR/AcrR family transcriptional regulator [Chitinilyticum piscinae]|uniref:TetR/AcrR family transcriptional regulator n=1 Tax=Chitinilyticum piscinae TaxID=2866724 RepID=A0A8J7K177_9NEIS|nr:TetR/AcrR family transcriptional regulator [Chitinilyticum piscinae]MBE9608257.1 TetR/AcrR family transcriptional regulator [Chitinilyticum piscinae]
MDEHRDQPSRRQRRKDARPSEITAAALRLFHERGFAATKLDDVAAAAGVTKGTLYLYFPSKEALFKAVVQESVIPNIDRLAQAAASSTEPPLGKLALVLRLLAQGLNESDGCISKLMLAEAGNFPELAQFYVDEVVHRLHDVVRGILSEGIATQSFRNIDLVHTPRLIMAPLLLANMWRNTYGSFDRYPVDPAHYAELQIAMLQHGLLPSPQEPRHD